MKHLITSAALAATLAFAGSALAAQDTPPGTSVQTGAASSNSMNAGSSKNSVSSSGMMSGDTSMNHSMKSKKKHASSSMGSSNAMEGSAMGNTDSNMVNKNSKMNAPGTKATGN